MWGSCARRSSSTNSAASAVSKRKSAGPPRPNRVISERGASLRRNFLGYGQNGRMPFSGFSPEGLKFLRSLKRNNRREWFQPRKEIFDTHLKVPMEQLVEEINSALDRFAPEYVTESKKAVFRI